MKFRIFRMAIAVVFLLVSCGNSDENPTPSSIVSTDVPIGDAPVTTEQPSETSPIVAVTDAPTNTPEPTPIPLAATVNGEPILLEHYDGQLEQFREWYPNGGPNGEDIRVWVLEVMIEQRLIEQEAAARNIVLDGAVLDQRIAQSIEDSGGVEAYKVYLDSSGFTEATFREQVASELLAQQVIESVTADVPFTDDFVMARYIQVDRFELAETVMAELVSGADFATLVNLYSIEPTKDVTKGSLGFFNRGTLTVPEVEEAAFALEPGQTSSILTATRSDGSQMYYIVETLERESGRPFTEQQRAKLVETTFLSWLAEKRAQSVVDIQIIFD